MFAVTALYAALLALLYLALSFIVSMTRMQAGVMLGDGGNATLMHRIRAHANFSEYVPLGLLLIALAEAQGASVTQLHLLGASLLLGRLLHALSFALADKRALMLRGPGMLLTFAPIVAAAIGLLIQALG